jgi:hypothetical protein
MDDKRISRRELLRTIGLAGAAAWAAPVLTSARASASIDRCTKRKSHRLCKGEPGNCTNGFGPCGTCSSDVGDYSWCFARFGDLKSFCGEDQFCSETHGCTSDADCSDFPDGVCITWNGCTACDTKTGVCTTRCCTRLGLGQTRALKPRRLGRTAAGR